LLWRPEIVNSSLTTGWTMTSLRFVIAVLLFELAVSASHAETRQLASVSDTPKATTSAPVLSEARPPIGWIDFCTRRPDECDQAEVAARSVPLTRSNWAIITKINSMVNNRVRQAEDIAVYGVAEYWDYPDKNIGDCEDFALQKRKLLIGMGVPRQALLMTVVRDQEGLGHAVLTVVTDKGDFILDNKVNAVLAWVDTGYSFVKRQSRTQDDQWVRLGDPAAIATTAAGQ
jgi:predicted transglutaminase-like cysteine proteinase